MFYHIRTQLHDSTWSEWTEIEAINSVVAAEIYAETFKLDNGTLVDIKNLGTYMIYATDDKTEYWASHVYI